MTPGLRRLYEPAPVAVASTTGGVPRKVDGAAVASVREEWEVVDRWWTLEPLRRRYFELALADGRATVVFLCAHSGRWYRQRA